MILGRFTQPTTVSTRFRAHIRGAGIPIKKGTPPEFRRMRSETGGGVLSAIRKLLKQAIWTRGPGDGLTTLRQELRQAGRQRRGWSGHSRSWFARKSDSSPGRVLKARLVIRTLWAPIFSNLTRRVQLCARAGELRPRQPN